MTTSSIRSRREMGTIAHPPEIYGQSVLGIPLEVWKPRSARCEFLLFAGIHGEEPETTVLLSRLLRSGKELFPHAALVLCANPDGLTRGTRGNAQGVDLNRNFPASNWKPDPVEHRWTLAEPDRIPLSPGQAPSSEPETSALLDLIEELQPEHVIALHAPLACIDDPRESSLGKRISQLSGLPLVPDVGYPTPGSFGSWGLDQGLHVITYELEIAGIEEIISRHLPVLQNLLGMAPMVRDS